ncbi:MAG: hypothetical protein JXA25_08710 [Anaerolineales bacterium]|nr:hypothetical protein [Anaerolineales bacterium]
MTGSSEGIGNTECAFENGSAYLQDTATVTIQFSGNGSMVLDHPEQEIWDETVHQFTRTSENTYTLEAIYDGMDVQWTIVFEWWGYQEQMELTYDCAAGICGCSSSFENRLR